MKTQILVIMVLALIACSGTETIKIGYIGPLSGPSAVLGMDVVPALQIKIDEINANGGINGKMVELIVEDDQYIASKTVTAYNKLKQVDDVDIFLVSSYSGVFALADQVKKDNTILIDPLDCNSELENINENIFCIATDTESIGQVLAEYLIQNNIKDAGVLYFNGDQFMPLANRAFTKNFEAMGGTVEAHAYDPREQDFKTQLKKMENAGAFVLLGYDETGLAMKQARELNLQQPFLTTGTITSPPLQDAAQGAAEGTILSFWEPTTGNQLSTELNKNFKAKVGRLPILPLTTHPAYDTMVVLAQALEKSPKNNEELKQFLQETKEVQGSTGQLTMTGNAIKIKEAIFKLQNGIPVKQ